MNAIYSIVLALILKKLIPRITKLITEALAKKRSNDLRRKIRRLQARARLLQEQSKEIEKKAIAAKALTVIKPIINYV
jgi:DNA polymerase III delta prime subunit